MLTCITLSNGAGAFSSHALVSFDHGYAALLLLSLSLCAWLYYTIYSSDPGSPADINSGTPETTVCEQCGLPSSTIRVRHDFATGAG